MVCVFPIGIPMWYLGLLWRLKRYIYPNNKGRTYDVSRVDTDVAYHTAMSRDRVPTHSTSVLISGTRSPLPSPSRRRPIRFSSCTLFSSLSHALAATRLTRCVFGTFVATVHPKRVSESQLAELEMNLRTCVYDVLVHRHRVRAFGVGLMGKLRFWLGRPMKGMSPVADLKPNRFPRMVRRVYAPGDMPRRMLAKLPPPKRGPVGQSSKAGVTGKVDGSVDLDHAETSERDDFKDPLPTMRFLFATVTEAEAAIVEEHAADWDGNRAQYDKHWDLRVRDSEEFKAQTDHIRFLFEVRSSGVWICRQSARRVEIQQF